MEPRYQGGGKQVSQPVDASIKEIHVLRGMACMMILMVHVTATSYYIQGETHHGLTFFLNQISRFGTPMFAMISGFLLFFHTKNRGFHLLRYVSSRVRKVLIPFLLWTAFYLWIKCTVLDLDVFQGYKHVILQYIILGRGYDHLWFMSVVLQFYLVFPVIYRLLRNKWRWGTVLCFSFGINLWIIQWGKSMELGEFLTDKANLINWIHYFLLAGFLADHWGKIRNWCQRYKTWLILLSFLVSAEALWELYSLGTTPSRRTANLFGVPILVLTLVGWFPTLQKRICLYRIFTPIEQSSMGIYLIHPLLLSLSHWLPSFFWEPKWTLLTWLFYLVVSILVIRGIRFLPFHTYLIPVPRKPATSLSTGPLFQFHRKTRDESSARV